MSIVVVNMRVDLRRPMSQPNVDLLSNPMSPVSDRLACLCDTASDFLVSTCCYKLRLLLSLGADEASVVSPVVVGIRTTTARHRRRHIVAYVVAELDVAAAICMQQTYRHWCWQLDGLLYMVRGPATCGAVDMSHAESTLELDPAGAIMRRDSVPYSAAYPWYRLPVMGARTSGSHVCIQAGHLITHDVPDDCRGAVLEYSDRSLVMSTVRRLVSSSESCLLVALTPTLAWWWRWSLSGTRCVVRSGRDLTDRTVSETWSRVVYDCGPTWSRDDLVPKGRRPQSRTSVVLVPSAVGAARFGHVSAVYAYLGVPSTQRHGTLDIPHAWVVTDRHPASSVGRLPPLHFHSVDIDDPLRRLVQFVRSPTCSITSVVDCLPECVDRASVLFGVPLSTESATVTDPPGTCPMCDLDAPTGSPVLELECAHMVCLDHLRSWPSTCAKCRGPIGRHTNQHPVQRPLPADTLVLRDGGADDSAPTMVVVSASVTTALESASRDPGYRTTKLLRVVDDIVNRIAVPVVPCHVVVISAHDSQLLAIRDELRHLGHGDQVCVASHSNTHDGPWRILLLAQRMVSSHARLRWVIGDTSIAPCVHLLSLSPTAPISSLRNMATGCDGSSTVTYVVSDMEREDMSKSINEYVARTSSAVHPESDVYVHWV